MKKMNLKFFRLGSKIVLPLFMLIGLFILSASSLNAQYVSTQTAKEILTKHIKELPPRTAAMRAVGHARTSQVVKEDINSLRHRYGQLILKRIGDGDSIEEAIKFSHSVAIKRIPVEDVDLVNQEYVDLLTH